MIKVNVMKKISALLLAFIMIFSFASCKDEANDDFAINDPVIETTPDRENKIKIAVGNDPMGVGFAKLSVDRSYAYDVEFCKSAEDAISMFKSGEADIVSVSLDTAAKLYNENGGKLKMLAINTMGMVYILTSDETMQDLSDLSGKTLYIPSDNAGAKAIFLHVIEKCGVSGIDIQYKTTEEIKTMMIDGTADLCVLPEYGVSGITSKTEKKFNMLALTGLWEEEFGFELAQGCIVAKSDYVEQNKEAIEEFLGFYEVSINYLYKNDAAGSGFLVEANFVSDHQIAYELVLRCNLRFVSGEEMKTLAQKNLAELNTADPALFDGTLPADDFYY